MNFLIPPVVPAYTRSENSNADRDHRKIVICLDGTGDQFDGDNSNVVKFFAALKKDDPQQLCYYQSGIGTYSKLYGGSLTTGVAASLDMAVGSSLGQHVRDAYSFLMQNYKEGDEICIYGFSRGAHTARALAGMLYKVGLLPADNQAQVNFAYKWYKDQTPDGWRMCIDFKRTFCIDVHVYFLGCWDTVASVGIISRWLPFSNTGNSSVGYFRHALALDERRAKFQPSPWYKYGEDSSKDKKPTAEEQVKAEEAQKKKDAMISAIETIKSQGKISLDTTASQSALSFLREVSRSLEDQHATTKNSIGFKLDASPPAAIDGFPPFSHFNMKQSEPVTLSLLPTSDITLQNLRYRRKQEELMKEFLEAEAREFGVNKGTDVLEVYFLGGHSNVGGSDALNETRHMLSRIPLRWMIRQSFACNTGLLFHADVLAEHGLDVETLWPVLLERKAPKAGPSPSTLDLYTKETLPALSVRRDTFRRRSSMSPSGTSMPPTPEASVTGLADQCASPKSFTSSRMATKKDSPVDELCFLPEYYEDYFDCQAPIHDALRSEKFWWILEYIPIKYMVQVKNVKGWITRIGPNVGGPRSITDVNVTIHWTVKEREKTKGYKIQCRTDRDVQYKVAY